MLLVEPDEPAVELVGVVVAVLAVVAAAVHVDARAVVARELRRPARRQLQHAPLERRRQARLVPKVPTYVNIRERRLARILSPCT